MIISILLVLLIIYVVFYTYFEYFLKKQVIDFSPKEFISKIIDDLKMETKVDYDTSSFYNVENNEIFFKIGDTLNNLFSGLHEFGHAFIDIYDKFNVFDKNNNYSISNISNNSFYYENKEYEKNINQDKYLNPYLYVILKYSPIVTLLLTIFRLDYANTILSFINIVYSFIGFIFFFLLIKEEYQASKIGYEIIKHENILNKKQINYCLIYYILSFTSYVILPIVCLSIFIYNIYLFI